MVAKLSKLLFAVLLFPLLVSANTKIMVNKAVKIDSKINKTLVQDYGSYRLYSVSDKDAQKLSKSANVSVLENSNYLLFDAKKINTQLENKSKAIVSNTDGLYIVQFKGPIKQKWLDSLQETGIEPIHYIANNGYLLWSPANAINGLNNSSQLQSVIQYQAVYDETLKKGASIEARYRDADKHENEVIKLVVQLVDSSNLSQSKQVVENLAVNIESNWQHVMKFNSARITVKFSDVQTILDLNDSYWVAEYFDRTLDDEVQNQILVANFIADQSAPAAPGYAAFLNARGFPSTPALYPIVDITDDGIGNGTVNSNDPTFHEMGDIANPTRLAYVSNCTAAATGQGDGGHGHLNLNIVGGFESRVGFPFIDPNGYIRTQGVNPFARIAGTRIFGPSFDLSACGGNDVGLIQSVQDDGANIMSNSWGCSGCASSYDDSSQAFDLGVRDADLTEAGNQELIMLFAAGNAGPGAATVGTPGNGKNMITVGASENFRPEDEDGAWTDGCAATPADADNAMDVVGFSSRGPSPGGRTKPEIIAPGTHIQGTASTGPNYTGAGVCDQFRPSGQTFVASSSGTSHSTPAAAGVASLIYYWLESNQVNTTPAGSITPSPALMKAYMMAHPTYLTGVSAADDLPSNSQGFGMPNMDLMFDSSNKFVLNQTVILDNTGEQWTWVGSAADPSKPVRITLAYTDQPGATGTSPQVNNLDLSVSSGGNTFLGNNFTNNFSVAGGTADALNNYEAVFFDAGIATDLTITVTGTNIAGDGVPNVGDATDQDFAIVCYNCAQTPTFTLSSTPTSLEVCSPDDAVFNLDVNSILGFVTPVNLTTANQPAGSITAFSSNPVVPTGTSILTVSNIAAATPGDYTIAINGSAGAETKSINVGLSVFAGVPATAVLTMPTDNATLVDSGAVTFNWDALSFTSSYVLEVATDELFTAIVHTATVASNTAAVINVLNSNTEYFWRVKASNTCGEGVFSAVFSFVTAPLPGECPTGEDPAIVQTYDFESGVQGWVSGTNVGLDTWVISVANPVSGGSLQHWHVDDQAVVTDTFLTSPAISLPIGKAPLTFSFHNKQDMENSGTTQCWDGGFLEISTDGGTTFTHIGNPLLLTDKYTGDLRASGPLQGTLAWCGNNPYINSIVDLDSFAGSTVNFRFRVSTDGSISAPGWDIDDMVIKGCEVIAINPDILFEDGFEN